MGASVAVRLEDDGCARVWQSPSAGLRARACRYKPLFANNPKAPMARLYEADAYDTARWPDSYWRASATEAPPAPPLEGDHESDVAIIGAGYAGLNAALELAERSGLRAVVLEAGQPGWGASGRNGGFCCHGGARLSDAQIRSRHGEAAAREWADYEYGAIERVRDNLARYGIEAET